MHAAGVVETLPTAHLDEDLLAAIRTVVRHRLPGLIATDAQGGLVGYLSSTDLLRLALPGYLRDEPCLARVFDEEHADRIAATLVGTRVGDVIGQPADRVSVVRPQATVVELAELMARQCCPLVLVEREGGGILGIVTANRLLDAMVVAAQDRSR
jgi:CBS domain-containing protein